MADMRAKVRINFVDRRHPEIEVLHMAPVAASKYDAEGRDENNTYAKYSPSGQFSLTIQNPALIGKFVEGEEYYVDFTKAPQA